MVKALEALSSTSQEDTLSPFYIIKDYRKTAKLKKQRELRKKKMIKEKEIIKEVEKEEKLHLISQINRSMLEEDYVWNRVQDDLKVECSEECYTTENEGVMDKKIKKLRWEVLFQLGNVEKRTIFD